MIAQYGDDRVEILMSPQRWIDLTKDTKWKGLRHPRSKALKEIDTALEAFDKEPSIDNFEAVKQKFASWLSTKPVRYNVVTGQKQRLTLRAAGAAELKTQIRNIEECLEKRDSVIENLNDLLNGNHWREKCLCAELYDPGRIVFGWLQDYVPFLEREGQISSGWARNIQPGSDIQYWSQKGQEESQAIQNWPNLPFKTKIIASSQFNLNTNPWPPWGDNHVRKGLFCHSSAALAAYIVADMVARNAEDLNGAIRSIDVIHQRPKGAGGMSHWWVCVNRPDRVILNNKENTFGHLFDFSYLKLLGGFVIDVWGALWTEQAENPGPWSVSDQSVGHECIADGPFVVLERDENDNIVNNDVRSYTHHIVG